MRLPEGWEWEEDGTGAFRRDGSWICLTEGRALWSAYHAKGVGVCVIVGLDFTDSLEAAEAVDTEYPMEVKSDAKD